MVWLRQTEEIKEDAKALNAAPLLQRLTHAHHAPVAKNAKDAADELAFYAVTFDILIVQELYQCLGHGQSNSLHILKVL